MLDKKRIFSDKSKQKDKCVKKQFLALKRLYQFLNKDIATLVHDKGTRNL